MIFTEEEILTLKLALAQYMYIDLGTIDMNNFDLKKVMNENGVDTDREANKILVSLIDKIEACEEG